MGAKSLSVTVLGLLVLLTACSTGSTTGQPTSTPAAPTTSTSAAPAPAGGTCPVGEYEVTTIGGKGGTEVNGVPIVAKSGGGLKLSLTEEGAWTLAGDGASVTLEAAGISVEATVEGSAEGKYTKVGSDYAFQQEKSTGKVTLKKPVAGVSSLAMDEVGPALVPGGKATLTCGADTLTISSESVNLELKRAGGSGGAPTTSTSSGGGTSGGTLTINDSAQTKTIDCAGRNVALNGSANTLTFTGSCGAISVNGSKNEIALEKVGQITVNGSANKITWSSGDPKVSNNGTGNTISQR